MITQEKVMFNADDIVEFRTNIEGWVGIKSRKFYGKNGEALARYGECTHKTCECGNIMGRSWTKCDTCRSIKGNEMYEAREFQKIDFPVYSDFGDVYFGNSGELEDWFYEYNEEEKETYGEEANLITYKDLKLLNCVKNYAHEVNYDRWYDELPEDGDLPKELIEKVEELNKFITTLPALSWSSGKYRTEYKG